MWTVDSACALSPAYVYHFLQKPQMDTKGIYEPLRQTFLGRQYYMTIIRPSSFSMTDLRVLAKIKALGLGRLSGFEWAVQDKVYFEGV